MPPKLQEIVRLFQSVQEPKAKYEQLLFYGKNLKPLNERFKTKKNKVEGCVSQVWVRAFLDSERNVVFEADSDSPDPPLLPHPAATSATAVSAATTSATAERLPRGVPGFAIPELSNTASAYPPRGGASRA